MVLLTVCLFNFDIHISAALLKKIDFSFVHDNYYDLLNYGFIFISLYLNLTLLIKFYLKFYNSLDLIEMIWNYCIYIKFIMNLVS